MTLWIDSNSNKEWLGMVSVGLCYNHPQNLLCSLLLGKSHQASLQSEDFTRSINILFFVFGIWTYIRLSFGTLIFKGRQSFNIFVKISLIYEYRETYSIVFGAQWISFYSGLCVPYTLGNIPKLPFSWIFPTDST